MSQIYFKQLYKQESCSKETEYEHIYYGLNNFESKY